MICSRWFLHSWGRWNVSRHINFSRGGDPVPTEDRTELQRECAKCGLRQSKLVKGKLG